MNKNNDKYEKLYQQYLRNIAGYRSYCHQVHYIKQILLQAGDDDIERAYNLYCRQMEVWQESDPSLKILVTLDQAIWEVEEGGLTNSKCYFEDCDCDCDEEDDFNLNFDDYDPDDPYDEDGVDLKTMYGGEDDWEDNFIDDCRD